MTLRYTPRFLRDMKKLSTDDQELVRHALVVLESDPRNPALRNHPLRGSKRGLRSITVTFDLRVVFAVQHGIAVLLTVGTHEEVY